MTLALWMGVLACQPMSTDATDTDTDTLDSGDSADTASDTGPVSALGDLSGDCGSVDKADLLAATPSYFSTRLDLGAGEVDEEALSEGGQEILEDGNAGGSSLWSEIVAFEVLWACEGAELLLTENEVDYDTQDSSRTDLVVALDGLRIGVSVTRAYAWPPEDPYTAEQAEELLEDKLLDIQDSSANVSSAHAWEKQILHVLAYTPDHAAAIQEAWLGLAPGVQADSIVLATATDGEDEFIY